MPNTNVPKIELGADNDAEITIRIAGYKPGKYIEIYGYVTQGSGTYVPFRFTGEIPGKDDNGVLIDTYERAVDLTMPLALGKSKLKKREHVTVVTWISEIWPSMLTVGPTSSNGKTVWELNEAAEETVRESMESLPDTYKSVPYRVRWVDVPATGSGGS